MRLNQNKRKKLRKKLKHRQKARKSQRLDLNLESRREENFGYKGKTTWYKQPDIFPQNMPKAERARVLEEVVKGAKESFDEQLPKLQDWFDEFDSCYLLSFYAFYFLGEKEGTTREHEGDFMHYQHYLEILQAISLIKPRKIEAKPLLNRAEDFEKQLDLLGTAIQLKHMDFKASDSDELVKKKQAISMIRSSTTAIRNWAYYFQMREVTVKLMGQMPEEFKQEYGISADELASAFMQIPQLMNQKGIDHQIKLRAVMVAKTKEDVVREYEKQFPNVKKISTEELEELFTHLRRNLKQLKYALLTHSDLSLPEMFTFTSEELLASTNIQNVSKDSFEKILDGFSYEFGDLASQNLEYIILDNPVLKKPFIKLSTGMYFCPISGTLPHFAINLIESMLTEGSELERNYNKKKGDYVEGYVAKVLEANFPNAKFYHKLKWRREDQPETLFETDNLLISGNFALVFESKSGKVSPPGKRGATDRLQKHLEELVLEPSRQANKLIKTAKENAFKTINDSNGNQISIDFSGVKYFIPISITLENLGMLSEARHLIESGMNKGMPPEEINLCMTMTDLQCVFEILSYEAMKLHYLVRRRELAMHSSYIGDEMDFLGFYLDNGFNIGQSEFDKSLLLSLNLKSTDVDRYFMVKDSNPIPPPETCLNEQWKRILGFLEFRKPAGWVEASFALLNCNTEDQDNFIKRVNKFLEDFKKGRLKGYPIDPCLVLSAGPPQRRVAIMVYPYKGLSREERNKKLENIMSGEDVSECNIILAFGFDIDKPNIPYDVLAISADSKLTEEPVKFIDYSSKTSEEDE